MSEDAERLSGGMDRGLQEALNIVEGRDYWDDGD
ncbi:hypothetical protein SEA_BIGPAOLINI_75 [Mycobacterium phage BigPaolini]|nr:hypothetical protein SEA_BIGPAOLINI_75 [Mycobacterium phage BigPaolini]